MRTPSVARVGLAVASMLTLAILAGGCSTIESRSWSGPSGVAPPGAMGEAGGVAADGRAPESRGLSPASDRDGGPSGADANRAGSARQMVYSARFEICTSNIEEAMSRFTRTVESTGGYLESREDSRVVCRIPAQRFQEVVATMPGLGSIVNQMIRNEDVTRKYHDLSLQLETAEWSRRRVLTLLDRAEKIEDIVKLEEELLKLTAAIEGLKGMLRDVSEQIAYSKLEVLFRARVPDGRMGRPDAYSPFAWINEVGAEQVSAGFGSVERGERLSLGEAAALLPGGLPLGPLDGFLVVKRDRSELKAITPDASKLWVRQFMVPQRGSLDFWSQALRNDLVDHRGYLLVEERRVRDGKGNEGVEMVCDVVVQGQAHRYLLTVYAVDVPFWHRDGAVRTVEFTAPVATFEKYAAVVRASCGSVPADKADERTERGSLSLSDTARKASGPRL